jgi:prepilin-type N-terminal cleavage/methylation domain-containing protein
MMKSSPSLQMLQRARRGFTMIEMMIAVAVSSVVVGGLYSIFNLQSRQFLYQDLQMEMHQNLRFATDMVTRSVRMAGYGAGGHITGYHGSSSDDSTLPVLMSWDAEGDGSTDGITVVYGDPSLRMNTEPAVEACDTEGLDFDLDVLNHDDKISEYSENELILCADFANLTGIESYLWVISSVSSASGVISVEDNSDYSDYTDVCGDAENLSPSMLCSKAHVITFYIDKEDDGVGPGSADHPVLMMDLDLDWPEDDDVPLVDNIEDLQIEYCVNSGSSEPDCSDDDEWVNSITSSLADDVWMVRVSMIGRSARKDPMLLRESTRPELANHAEATSADNYFRQVLVTEVAVRNLRHQSLL